LDDHWAAYFWSSSRLTRWPDKTSGDIPDAVMWKRHVENQRMGLTKTSVLMRWCMTKVSALKASMRFSMFNFVAASLN
jgi:hypothetical protein